MKSGPSPSTRAVIALSVAVLGLAACVDAGSPPAPAPASSGPGASAGGGPPPEGVPLPPEGVAAQLSFFQGGGGDSCITSDQNFVAPDEPGLIDSHVVSSDLLKSAVINSEIEADVPGGVEVCLTSFFVGEGMEPIQVDVTTPDGTGFFRTKVEIPEWPAGLNQSVEFPSFSFPLHIGDQTGTYRVVATQVEGSERTAEAEIKVRRSASPAFVAVGELGDPGRRVTGLGCFCAVFGTSDELSVEFGGFAPGSTVPLRVYGPADPDGFSAPYYETVEANADDEGQGILTLVVDAAMPAGCYQLGSEELQDGGNIGQFCVRS
jgi:hypothetical protein